MTAQQLTSQYSDEIDEYQRLTQRLRAICDQHAGIPNNTPTTATVRDDKGPPTVETFVDMLNYSGKRLVESNGDLRAVVLRLEDFFLGDPSQLGGRAAPSVSKY